MFSLKNILFSFLFFISSLRAENDFLDYFYKLSKDYQVLYGRIRNNRIHWIEPTSGHNDENRNRIIYRYFEKLTKKYWLPNIDFILCTEDGFHKNSSYPIFAFAASKRSNHNVFLFPDHEAIEGMDFDRFLIYSDRHPWNQKINKGFFRGAGTGSFDPKASFFGNDRVKVVAFSHEHPDLLEADLTSIYHEPIEEFLSQLQKPKVPSLSIEDHFTYKYLLDVDGNSATYSRGRWILLSNSVLLKVSSDFIQWYTEELIPYVHYVPVDRDLLDLQDIFGWLHTHDHEAFQIAMHGQKIALDLFTERKIDHYVYTQLLAYLVRMKTSVVKVRSSSN